MPQELPGRGWFRRADCADFLGMSLQVFDRDIKPAVPEADRRKVGREVWYRGPAVVAARAAQPAAAKTLKVVAPGDEDAQLFADAESGSPSLERWRNARARLAEIQVAREEETLCDVGAVRGIWHSVAARLRRAGESLQRRFGLDAWMILDGALVDAEAMVDRWEPDRDG
jgi:hypothetical protein